MVEYQIRGRNVASKGRYILRCIDPSCSMMNRLSRRNKAKMNR